MIKLIKKIVVEYKKKEKIKTVVAMPRSENDTTNVHTRKKIG